MKFILTHKERENIKQLHRKCAVRRYADKLKSLLLLDKGFSCIEVGEILLLDDDTVRKYREQYLALGVGSLLDDNNKGRSSNLTDVGLKKLEHHLEENTYMNTKGIIAWVKDSFGVSYSTNGINSLLEMLRNNKSKNNFFFWLIF